MDHLKHKDLHILTMKQLAKFNPVFLLIIKGKTLENRRKKYEKF